jgi:hypothetical protein
MKHIIKGMLTACLFYPLILDAQNQVDALRYSQLTPFSTARSLSMSGAFGALGADFSSLSINPAGIGVYRKPEFSFSLGFNNRNYESDFIGNKNTDSKLNIDVPDLGLVLAFPKKKGSEWKQFGFALGYNRTANFNSDYYYKGKNQNNSILDSFIDNVNQFGGSTPNDLQVNFPFDVDLAYQTYLLDSTVDNQFISVITNGNAYQSLSATTRGRMGEFSVGFGGNYNDKVYFGVTVAFPSIRYEEELTYEETDEDNSIIAADSSSNFKSLSFDQFLNTTGNGFNAKFGLIIKPAEWIRIGASIHSPTYYYLNDKYHTSMKSAFEDGSSHSYSSPEGSYSYNLTTPFRAVGSLALLYRQQGLISFDYELTDYSSSRLDASDYNFSSENKVINTIYNETASNFRAGIEWKYEKLAFRTGAAYYTTPFRKNISSDKTDQHVISYSGGVGFREKNYYIDLGYSYSKRSEFYSAYSLSNEDVPGAVLKRTDHRIIATIGMRF